MIFASQVREVASLGNQAHPSLLSQSGRTCDQRNSYHVTDLFFFFHQTPQGKREKPLSVQPPLAELH